VSDADLTELPGGRYQFGPPKSEAGRRVVAFPVAIVPDLTWHLARFTMAGDDSLVFTSPTGAPLRHGNFRRRDWLTARKAAVVADIHFHDLRHTGNHLTAEAGATLRELVGPDGPLHRPYRSGLPARHQRTAAPVEDGVGARAKRVMRQPKDHDQRRSGTNLARPGRKAPLDLPPAGRLAGPAVHQLDAQHRAGAGQRGVGEASSVVGI
jgi:hypothetical protein